MRILFTGGGTGGHFFPILAVIRELKQIAEDERILNLKIFYMGPGDFGGDYLRQEGVIMVPIKSGKIRNYFSFQNFLDVFRIVIGIGQAIWNTYLIMPDVVFSKGGYGALPCVIAAVIFRLPLIIHESDAIPGRVNKFSARFAKRIGVAFVSAAIFFPKEKTALVGIPVRKRILGGSLSEAKENFDIFSNLPIIGFSGASQGSEKINDVVLGVLKELTAEFEILHQTGAKNYTNVKGEAGVILEFTNKDRYHPFGFMNETESRDFYLVSDLIVSRAGASSIFETAVWGKPSILIPLKIATQDHQRKNAYEYANTGAATIIEEVNLTPHILFAEINKILGNPELMKKMKEAAQKFSRIDSAELIAREILKMGLHENT